MIADRTPAWGDLGNGHYRNPVLNADFSDPDLIRVGDDYYMVCSDFHFMGIPVLHSRDLVNWRHVGRVYDRLDIDPAYDRMERYGKGSWAPAIRWQAGRFYVYFCTPDEGLFMCSATDPAGPWTAPHPVKRIGWWEDPCPFWDEDGQAWLGHSIVGAGPITLHRMSPDGRELLDEGRTVYIGKIAEGTKIFRRNGWYYLSIPEGGVETGWQTVLRSRDICGPYERRVVLGTGRTAINGPHQGALVDTPSGQWWFMHFQSAGLVGRVCHLQPVEWVDDWPLIGREGEPVEVWVKPDTPGGGAAAAGTAATARLPVPSSAAATLPAGAQADVGWPDCGFLPTTSDDFSAPTLGLQWQWNHNPLDGAWSLTERPGWLRLRALAAGELRAARNTLTQKLIGHRGRVEVDIDCGAMADGQRAGLGFVGGTKDNWLSVRQEAGRRHLVAFAGGKVSHGPALEAAIIRLGADIDLAGGTRFRFSLDGKTWMELGAACDLAAGYWKGVRIGLFSHDSSDSRAPADFRDFRYRVDR